MMRGDCCNPEWSSVLETIDIETAPRPDAAIIWLHGLGTQQDFKKAHLDRYIALLDFPNWRTLQPQHLFQTVDNFLQRKLDI